MPNVAATALAATLPGRALLQRLHDDRQTTDVRSMLIGGRSSLLYTPPRRVANQSRVGPVLIAAVANASVRRLQGRCP